MSANTTSSEAAKLREFGRSIWQRNWLQGLFLIALVFVAYTRVFNAGFIWDDESHLTRNSCIVGPLGIKEIWSSTRAVYYPLVLTTFWVLHKFVGLNPAPYHILNVIMHAGSAVLLWRVLRELQIRGAWLGAALWALHPVMVQSVAWVTELKNTESCLFYLLSIFWFLKADAREAGDRGRWWGFGLAFLFFVMAILSKPSTVMLPAVLALCLWWRRGQIKWRDIVIFVPFLLISASASAWTIWEQKFHSGATGPEWAQTWLERLIIASRAIWFYLGKLIWPHPLIFIYPQWNVKSSDLTAYLPAVAILVGLVVLWLKRGRLRSVSFAASYFVISLFPVLGFFSVYFFRYSFVSDHFQYLASIGPLALGGAGITYGITFVGWKPFLQPVACGILLSVLGILTWRQTAIYSDVVSLYKDTLAKNPDCWMAHYNLGIALRAEEKTNDAIAHYRQAISLRPDYADAHYNLARVLVEKGEVDEAIVHYEKALIVNPVDAETHNNLGGALFQIGRVDEAIVRYQKALAIQPDYADASLNLANALLSKGDTDAAIVHYLTGLARSPNQANEQFNVANALLRKGRTDEAIRHYEKVLELRPDHTDAHTNLGNAFLQKGHAQDAMDQYRSALKIAPENVAAKTDLAWLLATCSDPSLRNGSEAVLLAEQANRLAGGDRPIILRILAAAYAEAGRFADATKTAQQALQLAESGGNSALVRALGKEVVLYQAGSPYRTPAR